MAVRRAHAAGTADHESGQLLDEALAARVPLAGGKQHVIQHSGAIDERYGEPDGQRHVDHRGAEHGHLGLDLPFQLVEDLLEKRAGAVAQFG